MSDAPLADAASRQTLSKEDIVRAFEARAEELDATGVSAEIIVVGGAALVLLYDARETTKDVDACIVHPEAAPVRSAAAHVAHELGLPDDWLNDAAKGFIHDYEEGETVFSRSRLVVRAPIPEQLLAMKLVAWRDDVDIADAALILSKLKGEREAL